MLHSLFTPHDIGRFNEIAGVFIRHGLGDLVRRLGWADALARAGHALHWESAAELARLTPPEQLRRALEELGPTFVKLGQILAGRADLLGPAWITELEKLHSHVPAVPWEQLSAQLSADLGAPPEQVFAAFDTTPLAAASIAQVHRARLHDGTEVVVKVRRPGIEQIIEADLRLLERLAAIATREWPELEPYRPVALVRQFGQSLRRELDLASECRHAERIARNFKDQPQIVIPRVVWAHTTARVNVQTYLDGIAGNDVAALARSGLDRHLLAQRGAHAVLKMIVQDGLFHADPHPGNVFYLPGNRIGFIDFGMVGRVAPRRREQLLRLLLGLVQRDAQAVAGVLQAWTEHEQSAAPDIDEDALIESVEAFVDQYQGTALARLSLAGMLGDVTAILRQHRLTLPADLALLIKAFITLEGLGRGLDPDFKMAAEALPLLRRALRDRYHPKALAERGWQSLRGMGELLAGLPGDVSRLLRAARRGRLDIHIDVRHLKQVSDQLDRAASRLTVGLVVAALIIGSSIVMTVGGGPRLWGLPAFGLIGFVVAVIGALWLIRSIRRSHRHHPD